MSKATPGPWRVEFVRLAGQWWVIGNTAAGSQPVCVPTRPTGDGLSETFDANCRLIAAAPELRDAVLDLLSEIGDCDVEHDDVDVCELCGWSHASRNRARALLERLG